MPCDALLHSLQSHIAAHEALREDLPKIRAAAEIIAGAFRAGQKLLVAGNGGSAADAQHFVAEFECTFCGDRRALPALCLTANSSTITAWANDYGYDTVFVRQLEAHGRPGDVFVAIGTGGGSLTDAHSRNIGLAAQRAKQLGLHVIGLAGRDGGALKELADICFVVRSANTARIQECHITILHLITELVETLLCDGRT